MSSSDPHAPHDRREAAQRNAERLIGLSKPGLVVAAITTDGALDARRALPSASPSAAAIAALPGVVLWAWPAGTSPEEIGRDLAAARTMLGEDTRAVVVLRREARVVSPPLPGEVAAEIEGVDGVPLVRAVSGLDEAELVRGVDVPWSEEADRRVTASGFVSRPQRG